MWEIVGGTRKVYVRTRGESGAGVCEAWRLIPSGMPASYQGRLVLDDASGSIEVGVAYDGSPPKLSRARASHGNDALLLECEEGSVDWFLSEDTCASGATAPIQATGCTTPFSITARDRARQALARASSSELRDKLLATLAKAKHVWIGGSCETMFVREGRCPTFGGLSGPHPRDRTKEPTMLRGGKPVYLFVETSGMTYPELVHSEGARGIALEEVAERNPHSVPLPGGEMIAMGCCCIGALAYDVLDVSNERADLGRRDLSAKPRVEVTWYFDKPACDRARASK